MEEMCRLLGEGFRRRKGRAAASRAASRHVRGTDDKDKGIFNELWLCFVNETHPHLGMFSKDWEEIYFQLTFIYDGMSFFQLILSKLRDIWFLYCRF